MNLVCTAEGKRGSSHLLTCAWKPCIINEMKKGGPHLGRWSSRMNLWSWNHVVISTASIFQIHQVQRKVHLPKPTTVWLKIKTCNLQCIKCQYSWNASCFYDYDLQFKCYHVTRIRRHLKNKGIKCSIPDRLWLKNIKKYRVKLLLIRYHFNNQGEWPRQRDSLYVVVNMPLFSKLTSSFKTDSVGKLELSCAKQASVYSSITCSGIWRGVFSLSAQCWPSLTCFFSWIFTEYYILLRFFLHGHDSALQLPTTVSISFLWMVSQKLISTLWEKNKNNRKCKTWTSHVWDPSVVWTKWGTEETSLELTIWVNLR